MISREDLADEIYGIMEEYLYTKNQEESMEIVADVVIELFAKEFNILFGEGE